MALAVQLSAAGHAPEHLATTGRLSLQQEAGGWRIVASALDLHARVPGIGQARFEELAQAAKANCPVSKVLNAEITLATTLQT